MMASNTDHKLEEYQNSSKTKKPNNAKIIAIYFEYLIQRSI